MNVSTPQPLNRSQRMPRHIAVIMDGNGRWATTRGRPRTFGHASGAGAVKRTVEAARRLADRSTDAIRVFVRQLAPPGLRDSRAHGAVPTLSRGRDRAMRRERHSALRHRTARSSWRNVAARDRGLRGSHGRMPRHASSRGGRLFRARHDSRCGLTSRQRPVHAREIQRGNGRGGARAGWRCRTSTC